MATEKSLIDSALRGWKFNVEQAEKHFGSLSPGQLEQQVAPGKNRLIYFWGHLAAVNDRLLPLLGIGERLHPEFDGMFISNSDKSVPLAISGQSLKAAWQEINQKVWEGFSKFSDSDWVQRHTAVSEQEFEREPHLNRFGVLLGSNESEGISEITFGDRTESRKEALEGALHGVSDEQCQTAGATRSGSVADLLSEM